MDQSSSLMFFLAAHMVCVAINVVATFHSLIQRRAIERHKEVLRSMIERSEKTLTNILRDEKHGK